MKTDDQLRDDVTAELKWEPSVHAAHIGVAVQAGVVTLSGHVSSLLEQWNAECAAQRVAGVKGMVMLLDVRLPVASRRCDEDIALAAEIALDWMISSAKGFVTVQVDSGWLTLTGEVRWQFQKQAIIDAVRHVVGVTGISNDIVITPQTSLTEAQAAVEASLKRCTSEEAQAIHVLVDGPVVTLDGSVGNWSTYQSAVHAAWSTPGVCKVVDKLVLAF